jgi:glycosyltransferase involved in cell wall biosynthesis
MQITSRHDPRELLSICIPTFNRSNYLADLLASITRQMAAASLGPKDIRVYISDNASSDNTASLCAKYSQETSFVEYSRNQTNIGGNANIIHVRTLSQGQYTWVTGDDELICDEALPNLIKVLRKFQPGLLLTYHDKYDLSMPVPQCFPDYRAFTQECMSKNPNALAEHTLISSNIYRSDCFDLGYAQTFLSAGSTKSFGYPHMFGMIRPLNLLHLPVYVAEFPVIALRDQRASGGGQGVWEDMDALWVEYFKWLKNELKLPELDPAAPSQGARKLLVKRIICNPFQFAWQYRHEMTNPSAWRFLFRRLFRKFD